MDNFDTVEETNAYMEGPEFTENSLGTEFDPEDLCAAVERGDDDAALKKRKEIGPRNFMQAFPDIMARLNAAPVGFD